MSSSCKQCNDVVCSDIPETVPLQAVNRFCSSGLQACANIAGKYTLLCMSMSLCIKRGDYQNCSVLYCVLKLCTVISTLR